MATLTDKKALKDWKRSVDIIRNQTEVNHFETPQEQKERIERAKKDYRFFVKHYFPMYATHETPDFHVKSVKAVKRRKDDARWRKWGRGLSKSVVSNVLETLWLWINDETKFLLLIGQNEDKAKLLLDDIRLQFEGNQRLIHDFGVQENPGHWESGFFVTRNGFIAKSIGMGQEPRGLRFGPIRPDRVICDDWETKETVKNPKRQREYAKWLLTSVIPTIDSDEMRIVLNQNKFAPQMIFDLVIEENSDWIVEQVNAFDEKTLLPTWKGKYAANFFIKRIAKIGILNAKAEYNNDPHTEGKVFTDKMIQWTKLPKLNHFDALVATWDVAFGGAKTSDYNAIRVWGLKNGRKYLIDCLVKQCKIRTAILWIADFQINLPSTVSVPFRVEKQFHNDEIIDTIDEIEEDKGIDLHISFVDRSRKKKFDRIMETHPQYQNGKVFYNEKLKDHNDTKEGLAQLKGIEPGYKGHDDAPDADKEAFDYLDKFKRRAKKKKFITGKRDNRKF